MESKIVLNQKTNNITITNAPTGTSQLSSTKNGTLSIIGGSTAIVNALIEKHNLDKEAHKNLWYVHEQGIASDRWEIQHNLNREPSVTVVDTANNVVTGYVTYVDKNNILITFNAAFKGKAYIN